MEGGRNGKRSGIILRDEGANGSVQARAPLLLPPDRAVLEVANELLHRRNIRINRLVSLFVQDPVLTLEVIGAANRSAENTNRPFIDNVRMALFRLGSENVLTVTDSLRERAALPPGIVAIEYKKLAMFGRRAGAVARIIAAATNRGIVEEAETAALMAPLGLMVACARYGELYAAMATKMSRPALIYRLQQDRKFDVSHAQLAHLEQRGFPDSLSFVYDRDFQCKTKHQSLLRLTVTAAVELVDVFDAQKWRRYAPGGELPASSALRLLQMNENQHAALFGECSNYFERISAPPSAPAPVEEESAEGLEPEEESEDLSGLEEGDESEISVSGAEELVTPTEEAAPVDIEYVEADAAEADAVPEHYSEASRDVIEELSALVKSAASAEEIVKKLLVLLVKKAPFIRVALLVVRGNRRSALVQAAVGRGLKEGVSIPVQDPLSPVALCSTRVTSFNTKTAVDLTAPFGVTAYALSPLKVKYLSPVLLYADCGSEGALPFEARRVFRLAVGLVNGVLPNLPGTLPSSSDIAKEARESRGEKPPQ